MMRYYEPEMEIIEFESVCTVTEASMLYKDPTTDIGGDYSDGGTGGGSMGDYMN